MIVSLLKGNMPFNRFIEETTGEKVIECRTREEALVKRVD